MQKLLHTGPTHPQHANAYYQGNPNHAIGHPVIAAAHVSTGPSIGNVRAAATAYTQPYTQPYLPQSTIVRTPQQPYIQSNTNTAQYNSNSQQFNSSSSSQFNSNLQQFNSNSPQFSQFSSHSSNQNPSRDQELQRQRDLMTLVEMGFPFGSAERALRQCNWDRNQAVMMLTRG